MVPMAFFISFFTAFLLSSLSHSKNQQSQFQKNIQSCLKKQIEVNNLQTLDDLYTALDKTFPLRTTEILFREVVFKKDDETRKLKLEKGKILLFKMLDDKTVKLLNNDARQKGLTEESSFNQLLSGTEVRSDWLKIKENRLGRSQLEYSRLQGKITALIFRKVGEKAQLECSHVNLSDICLCRN